MYTHLYSLCEWTILEADTQSKIKVYWRRRLRDWRIWSETNFSWYTPLYHLHFLSCSNISLKKLVTNKIPYNKTSAFQRKDLQNHFKESERLPGLSKTWLKVLTFPKKECVSQNWCWAVNEGEKKECPSGGHRSGPSTSSSAFPLWRHFNYGDGCVRQA